MTLDDIIFRVRTDILDDVARAAGTDSDLYWSDQELARYATEAEEEACRRARRLIFDDSTAAVTQFTIVDGTSEYTLHASVLEVDQVRDSDGTVLAKKTVDQLDRILSGWRTQSGTLQYWIQRGLTVALIPTPDSTEAGTGQFDVYRTPLYPMHIGDWQGTFDYAKRQVVVDSANSQYHAVTTAGTSSTSEPTWNTTVGGTTTDGTVTWTNQGTYAASPEISAGLHGHLVHWIAWRALSKGDEETRDEKKSDFHKRVFDSRFGGDDEWSASIQESRQQQPRSFRPIPAANRVSRRRVSVEDDPRIWAPTS